MNARFGVRDGSLYIDAATFEAHLRGREAVTLIRRDADLFVVPLLDSTLGGYLCKRRTAAGDRVIHAADFFRDNGFADDPGDHVFDAMWREDVAAFVVPQFFGVSA